MGVDIVVTVGVVGITSGWIITGSLGRIMGSFLAGMLPVTFDSGLLNALIALPILLERPVSIGPLRCVALVVFEVSLPSISVTYINGNRLV